MFKSYLTIGFRNLLRQKGYSFINLLGLSIGIACCLIITFYVQDELSYDKYHENFNQIYRVLHGHSKSENPESFTKLSPEDYDVWGNAPIGKAILSDFPEVHKVVQFTSPTIFLFSYGEKSFQENKATFMDSSVFEVFSWKLISGDRKKALVAPNSVVLSQSTAKKYFGDADPLGKILNVDRLGKVSVTGVMEDIPVNSHISFDLLISMSTFRAIAPDIFTAWGYVDFYTYLLVNEKVNIKTLQARVPGFLKKNKRENNYTIAFEPLSDAYLYSKASRQPGKTSSLTNVYIFSFIAIFILCIACINFINLSTARSMERAREVGVRKVVGAGQRGLIGQFLTESITLSFLATILGFLIVQLSLPLVEEISGKQFVFERTFSWNWILILISSAILVGILAGIYPAIILSNFRPAKVLKGEFTTSGHGVFLRKSLVVFQFTLSIALIAGTAVVYNQLKHLQSQDLGFQKDQTIVVDFGNDPIVESKIETIKQVYLKHPSVVSATSSRAVPGDFLPNAYTEVQSSTGDMKGDDPFIYEVDFNFIQDFGIKMAAGRPFSREFPADTANSLILNEAAAKMYGYLNPNDVVGKKFSQWGREGTVIGVVKNFNFKSLHTKVEPLSIRLAAAFSIMKLSLKLKPSNLQTTVADLEGIWKKVAPHRPFLYSFLDESFNEQYKAEHSFGKIFVLFSGLAIFIACLGLLGLATYTASLRTKEIGIRKVLGASVSNIVLLLSKDFMRLVLISIFIATPISWYLMSLWLDNFPYRINLNPVTFLFAGILAIIIALVTVSWQSVKASLANPVSSLRNN